MKIKTVGLLLMSLIMVAFGQPDRHPIFATFAYIFGYSAFFYGLLNSNSKKKRLLIGLIWALAVQLFQLNWFATTYYHGSAIIYGYVFLACWLALEFAILTLLLPREGSPNILRSLAIGASWTLFEWSRLFVLCGFPFNSVGLVLTFHRLSLQMASIVGVYGLSFWVIFTASLGAAAWQKRNRYYVALWLLMLSVPFLVGKWCLSHYGSPNNNEFLHVALIQIGLPSEQKWLTDGKEEEYLPPIVQWKRIFQFLEERGKEKYDLIVLPEAALPGNAREEMYSYAEVQDKLFNTSLCLPSLPDEEKKTKRVSNMWILQAMADHYQCDVIAGFLEKDSARNNYNSAFHVTPFKEGYERYDKRVLVPLVEYMPLEIARPFSARFGITAFFTHGKESKVFSGKVPCSVSICYEEIYSNLIREGRLKGAKMFINLTNDGWFPRSRLPIEHFNLGLLRAVENGVPVLRSCNTGVSAAIDCFGRAITVMHELDYKNEMMSGALVAKVNCHSYNTIFSRLGNGLIVYLSLIIIVFDGWLTFFTKPKYFTQIVQYKWFRRFFRKKDENYL